LMERSPLERRAQQTQPRLTLLDACFGLKRLKYIHHGARASN
jgi:hypothetical protein